MINHRTFAKGAIVASAALAGLALWSIAGGSTAASTAPHTLAPALSVLDTMRAAVEIPADGIWAIQSAEKLSDDEWLLAEQDAVALTASASLVSLGGIGPKDHAWASNADWQAWALDLQKTGLDIRAAVKAKDLVKLSAAADHLNDLCQSCHTKYRPDAPSDGIARYPFYPKRVLAK